jgi:hypothetical protein
MHRFAKFINTVSEELAAELISPNAIFYVPERSEPLRGPAGYLAIIAMMRGGFAEPRRLVLRFSTWNAEIHSCYLSQLVSAE